jgi:hypothetical protein
MRVFSARVHEILLDARSQQMVRIVCPQPAVPSPGRYVLAALEEENNDALPAMLFAGEILTDGFLAVPPVPMSWLPGLPLKIAGPLGKGFQLDRRIKRLALAALGESAARLLPLAYQALEWGADVVLFSDAPAGSLPASIELHPSASAKEALGWADFLALDMPLKKLSSLRAILGLDSQAVLPCPVQVLIDTPMPCGGMADCGVCAVPGHRSWKLACVDGPVFDLKELDW